MAGFVYILSNYSRTTLFTGVTRNPHHRLEHHHLGCGSVFVKKYNLLALIYFESLPTLGEAIRREKQLTIWRREWKIDPIRSVNPDLKDLSSEIIHF